MHTRALLRAVWKPCITVTSLIPPSYYDHFFSRMHSDISYISYDATHLRPLKKIDSVHT